MDTSSALVSWLLENVDHPIHFAAEFLLFICLIYLYSTKSYKSVDESLSQKEEEELIAEWNPEPLVSKAANAQADLQAELLIVEGMAGPYVQINKTDYLNLASSGFLGYQNNPELIEAAIECTNFYGVGACGPRGFYGSIEPHMDLEKKISQFMGCEDTVILTSEFQTIASVIPAFAKPGDYLISDKGVSFAIQNGMILSRAILKWFAHNDTKDLERVLQSLSEVFAKEKHRVFVLLESIYINTGDLVNLQAVLDLKLKYPFRIILEESLTIGVLGKTGRGLTEHLGIPCTAVDMITSTLGNALGSVGGFACGTASMGHHMRLNCNGYVFSCSSPPFLSKSAMDAVTLLETGNDVKKLQRNIKTLHQTIKKVKLNHLTTTSSELSPVVHFRLSRSTGVRQDDEDLLRSILTAMFEREKVVLAMPKYSLRETFLPEPSIKMSVSALHQEKEIVYAVEKFAAVSTEILKSSKDITIPIVKSE